MHSAFSWDSEVPSQILCSTDLPQLHNLWHSVPPAAKCPMQLNNSVLHCLPHALQVCILVWCCQDLHTPHKHVLPCAGWTFAAEGDPPFKSVEGFGQFDTEGCIPDTVNGAKNVRELYEKVNDTSGTVTAC